jgi:hypothetical protein
MSAQGVLPVTWTEIVLLAQELQAQSEREQEPGGPRDGPGRVMPEEALRLASLVQQFQVRLAAGPIRARTSNASWRGRSEAC